MLYVRRLASQQSKFLCWLSRDRVLRNKHPAPRPMITFEELLASPPKLHEFKVYGTKPHEKRFADGELINSWKLSDQELSFINEHINENSKTIETGAGCSTVVFARKVRHHTAIMPDRPLADRILNFCQQSGVPTRNVNFIIEPSETALPKLQERDFDLALIDGRHGFPQPFLDWYYIAEYLKIGGFVIIDDLHYWVCEVMANFLMEEKDWELVHESLGGCAFRKLGNGSQNGGAPQQMYVRRQSREYSMRAKFRYLYNLLKRGNYPLFSSTIKLGVQSALAGQFGQRPAGRR